MRRNFVWNKKTMLVLFLHTIIAICINIICYLSCITFHLPFWFDSIGTMLIGAAMGPIPGAVTGGLTTVLLSAMGKDYLAYAIVNMLVGFIVGICYPEDWSDYFQMGSTAAIVFLVVVLVATPLNVFFYDGYTGNLWGDALYDMLEQNGSSRISCILLSEAFVDFPDKIFSLIIAGVLLKVSNWIMKKIGRKNHEEIVDYN
ncbi:MAG: hypothetical protein ACI4F4_00835 [Lachnospiraceae bacterium]